MEKLKQNPYQNHIEAEFKQGPPMKTGAATDLFFCTLRIQIEEVLRQADRKAFIQNMNA